MGYCTSSFMGYYTGNLCVQRGGASISQHISCGNMLKRTLRGACQARAVQLKESRNPSGLVFLRDINPRIGAAPIMSGSSITHRRRLVLTLFSTCQHTGYGYLTPFKKISLWMVPKKQQQPFHYSSWRSYSLVSQYEALSTSSGSYSSEESEISPNGSDKLKKFVVVVESPAKAKTIEKYLGADFTVLPTYGHVRDLAARAGSVRPDDEYAMVWEVPEAAQTHVSKIKNALKGAKCLVLASDPDREGEAIAWHVCELMKAEGLLKNRKVKVLRVTFNEITKSAVLQAMQLPRDISLTLVNAYLARRALDHLIGFALSPVLWRKLPGSRSAGRVQSAALKLVCERESEIEEFVPQEYWTVEAFACCEQSTDEGTGFFPVRPIYFDGKKIEQFTLSSDSAKLLTEKLLNSRAKVSAVKKSLRRKNPPPPYRTSTLQQDAQAKLGFGAVRTMTLAQKLYEGVKLGNDELTGLITYMRTDGLELSKEAVQSIRTLAAQRYGSEYVPAEPRKFISKVKNAQEAHEAIRPTDIHRLPSQLTHVLDKDALSLYTLIWKRTMACQMEPAVYDEVSAELDIEGHPICLRATNSCISFRGFLAASEDTEHMGDDLATDQVADEDVAVNNCKTFPLLNEGDIVLVKSAEPLQHFTRPPARYSEGLLVKALEELGIGRPSTYAATLRTLQSRRYVKIDNHRIIPEVRGRMVSAFLNHYFPKFIDYNFTAQLEEQLDEVSGGRLEWKEVLRGFWPDFHVDVTSVMKIPIQKVVEMMQETFATILFKGLGSNGRSCPNCGLGKLTLKLSRYGSGYFFGCDSYPDCSFRTEVLSSEDADAVSDEHKDSSFAYKKMEHVDIFIGIDPSTQLEVRARKGPFGYYIQLGQDSKRKQCFKIPEGVDPADISLEKAIQIMKYPMTLGKHPDDGEVVVLGVGKKSFFIRHRSATTTVPKDENVEEMSLDRAVELLKGKDVRRRGRKSLLVLAAEEEQRKLELMKRTAKYLKKSDTKSTLRKISTVDPEKAEGKGRAKALIAETEKSPRHSRKSTDKEVSLDSSPKTVKKSRSRTKGDLEAELVSGENEFKNTTPRAAKKSAGRVRAKSESEEAITASELSESETKNSPRRTAKNKTQDQNDPEGQKSPSRRKSLSKTEELKMEDHQEKLMKSTRKSRGKANVGSVSEEAGEEIMTSIEEPAKKSRKNVTTKTNKSVNPDPCNSEEDIPEAAFASRRG